MLWIATGERLTAESFEKYRRQGGFVATFTNTEEMVEKNMAHPLVMVASDGILENGFGHPRVAGTYSRAVLGRYVRERKALSLPEAIRKMSPCPPAGWRRWRPRCATRDAFARAPMRLCRFNPDTVIDRATFEKPNLP